MSIVLNRLSAVDAVRMLNRRELSAAQLARACFARIEQRDPTVRAWAALDKAVKLAQAEALDRGPITGVLHGLPVGVKDVFDTVDFPTRYGSPIYEHNRPAADAAAVALCRQAGALVLGKTATTEFAGFHPPATRNPRNIAYTPGGSSSGSAAAVADDMVPFALGTQTAGSIIRPAAYCGVVGFKPSYGAIPRAGLKSLAESLDTIGGFARSVDDVALFASVMMSDERLRQLDYDDKPRIGMYRTPLWRHTQAETKAAWAQAAAALARAGAEIEDVEHPPESCAVVQLQADIMAFEASRALAFERSNHVAQMSPSLTSMLESGARITAEQHRGNLALAQEKRRWVDAWFDRYDVLLTPSAVDEAPYAQYGTGDAMFCRGWTLFGTPCVHLPFANGPHGMPVGLQVVGRFGADRKTLALARWIHNRLRL